MKRIIRDRRLTPEEIAHYNKMREQIEQDLPELVLRHHIQDFITQLRDMRDNSHYRSNIISENGIERSDVDRAKSEATAGAYDFVIIMLQNILEK